MIVVRLKKSFLSLTSTQTNGDMTELLKQKAQEGELDECGSEQLVVIEKIK